MIINNSNIAFSNHRAAAAYNKVEQSLRFWIGPRPDELSAPPQRRDSLEIGHMTRDRMLKNDSKKIQTPPPPENQDELALDADFKIIRMMFKEIFGEDAEMFSFDFNHEKISAEYTEARSKLEERNNNPDWGMEYNRRRIRYEYEKTSFEAKGVVNTADGKQIMFSINLEMEKEIFEKSELSVKAGNALADPLVINFDGKAAELSDRRFLFDLNLDGRQDNINYLRPGRGFLAFDRNDDGRINDGSEMFGAKTGDGFGELAKLDDDKNGWIDENDNNFENLKVWEKDDTGKDSINSLKQKQIGAIYLDSAPTLFNLYDRNNALNGRVARSGVFLNESGAPGIIQKVDLSI